MTNLTNYPIYEGYGDIFTTTNNGNGFSLDLAPMQDAKGHPTTMSMSMIAVNFDRSGDNSFQLDGAELLATAININSVAKENPVLPGTGGVEICSGTTGQRLGGPGTFRYSTTLRDFEGNVNGTWTSFTAGAVTGPNSSVAGDIAVFDDTTGEVIADSGVNIGTITAPLASLFPEETLVDDIQLSGVDVITFRDIGLIFTGTGDTEDVYVCGFFPNTPGKSPNTVFGFANPSSEDAVLELTQGAFLPSRLTQTQINALNAVNGMYVYNSTTNKCNFRENGSWNTFDSGSVVSVTGTANQINVSGSSAVMISIVSNPIIPGTGNMVVPSGSTAQRLASMGGFRFNSETSLWEGYNGSWVPFASGSGGGTVTSITAGSNLTGGVITAAGTIALSNTPSGLTSLGVGNLSLSANQIISNTNGNINILPNGTGLVNLGAFPVTVNAAGTIDAPTGIIDVIQTLDIALLAVSGNPGLMSFYDANNSNFVSLRAPAVVSSNITFDLMAADGTNGQAIITNGSAVLSFTSLANRNATFIIQTPDASLPSAQDLETVADSDGGILKVTPLGVLELAEAGVDYATVFELEAIAEEASISADEAFASATAASVSAGLAGASAGAAAASAVIAGTEASNAAASAGSITGATSAEFLIRIANTDLPNAQIMGLLDDGLVKNETSTGIQSIAVPGVDYYAPEFPTTLTETLENLFIGNLAGNDSLIGEKNTAVGISTQTVVTSGTGNTSTGRESLKEIITSNNNSAFGYQAGSSFNNYDGCTFLGKGADCDSDALSNAMALGADAIVSLDDACVLGNLSVRVGIGTSAPYRTLTVIGGQIVNLFETPATTYAILDTDYIIGVADTSSPVTITLPAQLAPDNIGQIYVVKDQSGGALINNITIEVSGGANIDGNPTVAINTNYGSLSFYCNGAQWFTF